MKFVIFIQLIQKKWKDLSKEQKELIFMVMVLKFL